MGDNPPILNNEDDPVVQEIPIFLSKRLAEQMYVFQYPLHPKSRGLESDVKKCLFKPKNQETRMEVSINTDSPNFDTVKAEYIAEEVDKKSGDKKKEVPKMFPKNIVDKIMYNSTRAVKDPKKYAVGVYNGKEYHITPLKGFLQLRPNFSYMDRTLKRKRDNDLNGEDSEEEEVAGPSSAQQVTVKFARNETDQMKKARENSFKRLQERSAQEPWVQCQWKSASTTQSEVLKHKLFAENVIDIGQAKDIQPMEYVRLLIPEDQEEVRLEEEKKAAAVKEEPLSQS